MSADNVTVIFISFNNFQELMINNDFEYLTMNNECKFI